MTVFCFARQLAVTAAVVLFFVSALPDLGAETSRVVLAERPAAVAKLTPTAGVPATNLLTLALGLPLRDSAGLDGLIADLYTPASTNFHRFLTPPELAARFGPTEADYLAVRQFAASNGLSVTATYSNRMVVDVTGSARDVEHAFQIKLNRYRHPTESREFFAPDQEPSVPAGLRLASIEGLTDFSRPRPAGKLANANTARSLSFTGSGPNHEYIGNDFRNAYVPGTTLTGAGQTVALLEYSDYFKVDVTNYENAVGASIGATNYVPLANIVVGGFTPGTGNNLEVALDIEMAIAMAPKLSRILVYEQSAASSSVLSQIQSDNQARQVSSSWALGPWSSSSANTWDNILKLMIAQGQSYFQSSGDSDAYTGSQTLDAGTTVPTDSPYATIVGGTSLNMTTYGVAWSSESVWNYNLSGLPNEGSGGGISSYYAIPSWQTNVSMANNNGSASFRNIPDVALTADNIYICFNNGDSSGSSYAMGTSAAAPLWAGFIALVNQQAAQASLAPVGFINPAVYALATNANYGTVFHDITAGNNTGTNTPNLYNAVAKYDLATGLGTPNGTNLINALAPVVFSVAITNGGWSLNAESGLPHNGTIDPGETVTLSFTLLNQGNLPTANLVATLLASTNVLAPSAPQSYGALAAYGGVTNRLYTFTAAGNCGSAFAATLQLQDGASNLGTATFVLPLGAAGFTQNFDAVTVPALPAIWSSTNINGAANSWVTTASTSDSPANSAFVADIGNTSENALVSPIFNVVTTNAQLTFRHNFSFEYRATNQHPGRDGGVLEIQMGAGSFTDILSAGGNFTTGGYNGVISSGSNPLVNRSAWISSSSGWQTVTVTLPAAAAGQNVRLRWACATDNNSSGTGWNVDSISLQDGSGCQPIVSDLAVSQTIAPSSLVTGQNLSYTLTITNLGPQAAANLIVTDTIPANASFVSAPGGTYASGQATFTFATLPANAATNFTLTLAPGSGSIFTNLANVVTITPESTVTNNSSTLIVTQSAGVPPAITIPPAGQTIQCSSNASFTVTATGTAPLKYQWSLDGAAVTTATNTSLTLSNVHLPSHTIAVVVTNLYGSATNSALLTVQDTLAPTISLASTNPYYVQLGNAYTEPGATAADACAGTVPVNITGTVNTSAVSTNFVLYVATDGNGNTNTLTRTVLVVDTKPPTIVLSFTNLSLAANSNCTTPMPDVTGTNYIVATDVSGSLTITQSPTNNATLSLGTNVIVISVADASGNKSFSTNRVVVRDQTAPLITLNGITPLASELGLPFTDPGVTASDACSGIATITTNGTVNISVLGTNMLSYTATDNAGNTNSVTRLVVVQDTTPPAITWSFTNLVLAADTNCAATMPDVTSTNYILATDSSGTVTISQNPTNNSVLSLGTNRVILAALDGSGNMAYSTNQIVVADQTPPQISAQPQNQTVVAGNPVTFSVTATACTPLSFQWFFGPAPLTVQTNSVLTLSNVTTDAAGNYSVVVAANGGATTSGVATLTVISPASIALVSSANPAGFKDSLTFTATISPAAATGAVQFLTNGVVFDSAPLMAGAATSFGLDTLPRGTNCVTAIYVGNGSFLPATNSLAQVVTNHPPVVLPVTYYLDPGQSLTIAVADLATNWSDPDGDALFLTDVSTSTNGVVVTNSLPALFYTNTNIVNDQFTCTISDGFGGTNFELITVTITPPTNTTPQIAAISAQPGSVTLQLGGAYGSTYVLETAGDLLLGPWESVATNTLGLSGTWQFTDFGVTNTPNRFYRLRLQP